MENNKNEFDDIILEKSNKSEKIKKILLRIIALVILFLAIMVVMKLINNDDESTQESIFPSEPVSENTQNNDGFENMPITENTSPEDQFEALRKQFQQEEQNLTQETNLSTENLNPIPSVEQEPQKSIEATKEEVKQESVENKTIKQEPKQEPKKQENPKKENTKQSTQKAQNPNDLFKNVESKPIHPSGLASGIYVQIFSVSNLDQKSKELAAVKQKGYDYKLYKTSVNGKEITKVLIGPFEKENIANELAKIRKEVAKDAFSFTLQ